MKRAKRDILTYILTYLLTYILTYILTYLLTYILTYLLTYILTYLLTDQPSHRISISWLKKSRPTHKANEKTE